MSASNLNSPAQSTTQDFATVFARLKPQMRTLDVYLRGEVAAFEPEIREMADYCIDTSGKRIRPALVFLSGWNGSDQPSPELVRVAAVVELVHLATLVHDDIMDGANTRRMVPTANAKWGNALSVLLGDVLFSHALTLATDFNSIDICRKVGNAAREVCQGEIIQTQRRFDLTFTKAEYFRVIEMKTGALFAAATGLSANLSGLDAATEARLYSYGMKLGTAYQIYDDCLDLVGSEEIVGKTLRTDLLKGKLTLPILNLLENASEAQRIKLNKRILDQEPLDLPILLGIAEYEGAIESAVDTAMNLLVECREDLAALGKSVHSDALAQITWFLAGLLEKCRR